jgi:hypothetical protein
MYYKENPYTTFSYPQQSTPQDQYERLRHRDSSPLLPDGYVEANDDYSSGEQGEEGEESPPTPTTSVIKSYLKNPWVMLALVVLILGLVYYLFFSGTKESYSYCNKKSYRVR